MTEGSLPIRPAGMTAEQAWRIALAAQGITDRVPVPLMTNRPAPKSRRSTQPAPENRTEAYLNRMDPVVGAQVAAMTAEGKDRAAIAAAVGISIRGVSRYRERYC